jgi:hypothetical protein
LAEALAHQARFDESRPFAQQAVNLFKQLKHADLKRAEKALRNCDRPKQKSRK